MGTTWFRRDRRKLDQQAGDGVTPYKPAKNTNADNNGYALAA